MVKITYQGSQSNTPSKKWMTQKLMAAQDIQEATAQTKISIPASPSSDLSIKATLYNGAGQVVATAFGDSTKETKVLLNLVANAAAEGVGVDVFEANQCGISWKVSPDNFGDGSFVALEIKGSADNIFVTAGADAYKSFIYGAGTVRPNLRFKVENV